MRRAVWSVLSVLIRRLVVPLSMLAIFGCRLLPSSQDGEPTNVTASNSETFFVDEAHRFRLEWPGDGWLLLKESQLNTVLPSSEVSAYDTEQGLLATVSVGHAPQASLPAYVDDWLQRLACLNKQVLARQRTLFQNCTAERFEVNGAYGSQYTSLLGLFFYHQNYVYRLLVQGSKDSFDRTRAQKLFDSFTLLPGKVRASAVATRTVAAQGVGWRVRDGQYESGITGLNVAAPSGWQLLVGNDLREFSPDADVALVRDDPGVSLVIRVQPAPIRRSAYTLSESQRAHRENMHVTLLKDTFRLTLMGSERLLRLGRSDNGNLFAYGSITAGSQIVDLIFAFSELFRTAAPDLFGQIASHITLLPEPARIDLRHQLLEAETLEHVVARDVSLRSGCYIHYANCVQWCRPPEFWELLVGSGAQNSDDRLLMIARNVETDLVVELYMEKVGTEGSNLFQRLRLERGLQVEGLHSRIFTGRPARCASGRLHKKRPAMLCVLEHRDSEIGLLVSCGSDNIHSASDMQRAFDSLRLDDCRSAIEVIGRDVVDHRFGFSLILPEPFQLTSRGEAFGEAGQKLLWTSPDAKLTLVTLVPSGSSGNSAELLEAIDQVVHASVPPALLRMARASSVVVRGEVAQRTTYAGLNYRFDTVTLKHGHVLMAWLYEGRKADTLEQLLSGLQWLN